MFLQIELKELTLSTAISQFPASEFVLRQRKALKRVHYQEEKGCILMEIMKEHLFCGIS